MFCSLVHLYFEEFLTDQNPEGSTCSKLFSQTWLGFLYLKENFHYMMIRVQFTSFGRNIYLSLVWRKSSCRVASAQTNWAEQKHSTQEWATKHVLVMDCFRRLYPTQPVLVNCGRLFLVSASYLCGVCLMCSELEVLGPRLPAWLCPLYLLAALRLCDPCKCDWI